MKSIRRSGEPRAEFKKRGRMLVVILTIAILSAGCARNAATNERLVAGQKNDEVKATYKVENREGSKKDALVILALSGGGSRAALFSSLVMLHLDEMKIEESTGASTLLKEVDVISSVSGGSLAAAYYAISKDPGPGAGTEDRIWERDTVTEIMERNYRRRWIANWFWPQNIINYWFTAYNRSDIMAQTFADNFLDTRHIGTDYKFKDINPTRPTLVLNSTIGTKGDTFGQPFTFTVEKFDRLQSDLANYDIARAVMASASFPGVFSYMHLRDYSATDEKYVHVFDGGNTDNLGVKSAFGILDTVIKYNPTTDYNKIVLILVDVYTDGGGISPDSADTRESPIDYFVDTNFLDSYDSLLSNNRENLVQNGINYFEWLKKDRKKNVIFYHIMFDNLDAIDKAICRKANSIPTDFKIDDSGIETLKRASKLLITKENECLQRISGLLTGKDSNFESVYCTWPTRQEDMVRIQEAPKAPVAK